jgi:hypothetical protein
MSNPAARPWARNFNPVQAVDKQLKIIAGTLTVSGSGQVTATNALGVSGSYQGSGVYRLAIGVEGGFGAATFARASVPEILSVAPAWQGAAGGRTVRVSNVSAGLTGTGSFVDITTEISGSGANPGAGALHFQIAVKNSVVG